uniref:Ig-like domain-containing protein n=1 Tax=Cyprinodon variegatus TaxID=28743 RepID=A0A3Q2CSL8_CYPVA
STPESCSLLLPKSISLKLEDWELRNEARTSQLLSERLQTKNNQPAIIVEWIRDDMEEEEFVALYRGGRFDPEGQDPGYRNRVDLQDREMKERDVSLVLKKVTTDDTGTYECRVIQRGNKRRKRSNIKVDPICIISLDVAPRPPSGESVFLCIRTSSSLMVETSQIRCWKQSWTYSWNHCCTRSFGFSWCFSAL